MGGIGTSNQLTIINITLAIVDTIIAAIAIAAFGWGAWFFGRWWILLFTIIPLALFNSHSILVENPSEEGDSNS